jgi:hypothetical protein
MTRLPSKNLASLAWQVYRFFRKWFLFNKTIHTIMLGAKITSSGTYDTAQYIYGAHRDLLPINRTVDHLRYERKTEERKKTRPLTSILSESSRPPFKTQHQYEDP